MTTTNFTNNVTLTDAGWFDDADTVTYAYLTSVAGTNTITATGPVSLTALAAGQRFYLIPAATNTGATTLAITGATALSAKNVFYNNAACIGGELKISVPTIVVYDGTQFQIIGPVGGGGTWTPVLTFATAGDTSASYTTQIGRYSIKGNEITAHFNIQGNVAHTTASGNARVAGLPKAAENVSLQAVGALYWTGITKANYTNIVCATNAAQTYLEFLASGSGQVGATISAGEVTSSATIQIFGTIIYRV